MRLALLLLCACLVLPGYAEEAANATPDPRSLAANWWNYLGEAEDELGARIDTLLESVSAVTESGERQAEAQPFLERLRLNLRALPGLRGQQGTPATDVPAAAESYRLGEVLELHRELRKAQLEHRRLQQAIGRGESSMAAAQRRIDTLTAAYLALPEIDPLRLPRGLQIMASRAELASSQEQLRVRKESRAQLEDRLTRLESLVDYANGVIVATPDEVEKTAAELAALEKRLTDLQNELRERQARALGARGETPAEQADHAWRVLRVLETEATETSLTLEILRRQLELNFLGLALPGGDPESDQDDAETALADADEQLKLARVRLDDWEQQAEQELAQLRDTQPDAATARADRRRLATANQLLTSIGQARSAAADLEFVEDVLRARLVDSKGVVGGGFAAFRLWFDSASNSLKRWGDASLFRISETPVTIFGLFRVALILFVAIWLSRLLRHALDRVGSRKEGTASAFYTVGRLAHYVIIAAGILIGLATIGLNFSNLAIVAGALGVGIGFGLQSIVNNFVSGLILLFERSLKVGDYVELESGVGGIVKEINVRSTLINTNQNLDILVPNSEFVSGRLTNWTLKESSRRLHIPFGVAYGSDKDKVKEVVLERICTIQHTVNDNPLRTPDVWLTGFGDSSLDFELVVWVKQSSVRNPGRVTAGYLWEIESALTENGIEIPFPQRDLHLRSGFPAGGGGND